MAETKWISLLFSIQLTEHFKTTAYSYACLQTCNSDTERNAACITYVWAEASQAWQSVHTEHLFFVCFFFLAFLPPSEGGVFSRTQSCVLCCRDGHGAGLPPLSGHCLQVNTLKQALLPKSFSHFSLLARCSFSCPLMILTWSTLSHAWNQ